MQAAPLRTRPVLTLRSLLLALLLGFSGLLNLTTNQPPLSNCLPSQELSLGFGLAQPGAPQPGASSTPALDRILTDDCGAEFVQTEQVLASMNKLLETFALQQGLKQAALMEGHEISRWLASQPTTANRNPLLAGQANQLDFIYGTWWSPFMHLIQRIITERPSKGAASFGQLAFRCEQRAQELQSLQELASKSSIYRVLLDVFNTELYTHCLRRKLATLRLHQIEPPAEVRQLVDVYLELPLDVARSGAANFRLLDASRANQVNRVYADYGQNFNLERALRRYGGVEQAVQLVLTSDMSFGRAHDSYASTFAGKFRQECSRYTGELVQFWGNFDQVAAGLSSDTNNLADFNNRLKLAEPHLIYASICNQLTNY